MSSYFKTSSTTLKKLAQAARFEDVAGFLVLARHATGLPVAGFDAYKLSGAGINSIREKAGLSEETARGVIERLQGEGILRPVAPDVKKAFFHARWEVVQGELDLELPHALIDRGKVGGAESALRRIKSGQLDRAHLESLQDVSDSELRLDALMVCIEVYRHTRMEAFGGLDPHCVYREWDIKSQVVETRGVRWGAEPQHEHGARGYTAFMTECLQHAASKKIPVETKWKRFWSAWQLLQNSGLIYEAVTLFDVSPSHNPNARSRFTLRVNDYHAGSVTKTGDPSLLRTLEETFGTKLAFYTPPTNDRDEPEAMRVMLTSKRGAIVGVWRPRFRAATKDVGAWVQKENEAISATLRQLVELQGEAA